MRHIWFLLIGIMIGLALPVSAENLAKSYEFVRLQFTVKEIKKAVDDKVSDTSCIMGYIDTSLISERAARQELETEVLKNEQRLRRLEAQVALLKGK